MKQQSNIIADRIVAIKDQIERLQAESAMLSKFRMTLRSCEHLLRDEDVFSTRTSAKFELLARVADHLNGPDPFLYGGSSTKAIYEAVLSSIDTDRRSIAASLIDRDRIENGDLVEQGTPMETDSRPLNYGTFRSYLARFKDEGRIFFNAETRRWRIRKEEVTASNLHDEGDRYEV
jgi:hypothetical protein